MYSHVVLLGVVVVHLVVVAGARGEHVHLAAHQLVAHLDVVVVHGVGLAKLSLELRRHGYVEHELVGAVGLEVNGLLLLLVRHRLAEHLYLVLAHVLVNLLAYQLVHHVRLHGLAILALYQAHGHHARAESRHVSLLAVILQLLLYIFFIVLLLKGQREQAIDFVGVFE